MYMKSVLERTQFFQPKRKLTALAVSSSYRVKEKLVYKAISSYLVFGYDNKRRIMLNSANALIPEIDGMSIKVVCAFLNSKVFQFLFKKKYNSIKILRHNIESFPFPIISTKLMEKIERMVNQKLEGENVNLDALIYKSFNLDENDIKQIEII